MTNSRLVSGYGFSHIASAPKPTRLQPLSFEGPFCPAIGAGKCHRSAEQPLLLPLHRLQTSSIKLEQVVCVVFRLGGGAGTLKSDARRTGPAVPGRHGDKFHQIEGDVLVAA